MKSLRQLCATLILTIVFATATFAEEGIIHGGAKPPSPAPLASGVIHGGLTTTNTETQTQDATMDFATEMTLLLVQNMLALF